MHECAGVSTSSSSVVSSFLLLLFVGSQDLRLNECRDEVMAPVGPRIDPQRLPCDDHCLCFLVCFCPTLTARRLWRQDNLAMAALFRESSCLNFSQFSCFTADQLALNLFLSKTLSSAGSLTREDLVCTGKASWPDLHCNPYTCTDTRTAACW